MHDLGMQPTPTWMQTRLMFLLSQTPSLNAWQRWHWAKRDKLKKKFSFEVRKRLNELGRFGVTPPFHRMLVVITRWSPKQLDPDNMVGGCKALVDALKQQGVIRDDSEKWAEIRYKQVRCAVGEECTEVEVVQQEMA